MGTWKTLTGNLGTAVLTCVLLIGLRYLTDLYHTTSLNLFFKGLQNQVNFDHVNFGMRSLPRDQEAIAKLKW